MIKEKKAARGNGNGTTALHTEWVHEPLEANWTAAGISRCRSCVATTGFSRLQARASGETIAA